MEQEIYNVFITSETKINESMRHDFLSQFLGSSNYSNDQIVKGINILLEKGIIKRGDNNRYIFKRYM